MAPEFLLQRLQPCGFSYRYVYAAQRRYPLIENANAPAGKLGPRSNPSPKASRHIDAAGTSSLVTVMKDSSRVDVDEIWIYRTAAYATQAEAELDADAGFLNYVGSIANDGSPGTVTYDDNTLTITGNPEVETDNFPAPQFQLCTYDDPYFYGFGNFQFKAPILVTALGVVTLTDAADKWFDGRNGQTVTMEGITTGGFDGYGSYYFKWIDNITAQLCLDAALTQNGPVDFFGTTEITISGKANILYRSKERNPLSWGLTDVIDDVNVPRPYAFTVGGGFGTAIGVVPILNLLKVDTVAPNKTFVFNLNGKGTPQFEGSKREISSDFATSNFWTQFPMKDKSGQTYLWFSGYSHASYLPIRWNQ
jgi:hypothetical protein